MRKITALVTVLCLGQLFVFNPVASAHEHRQYGGGGNSRGEERGRDEEMQHPFGLGIILGEPTGVTGKFHLSPYQALDFGFAYSFNNFALLYADLLFQVSQLSGSRGRGESQVSPYIGVGILYLTSFQSTRSNNAYFTSTDTVGLGIRIPVGLEFFPGNSQVGIFAEIVPGIGLLPSPFGFFEGGGGVRYYF